jgi:DNA (cytosine-5)-methyltransferase 1
MKIGSLCTGYGGLDLAVEEHFGAETVWCAEYDKYASQVIEQRFGIPNYGDISQIDWDSLEPVDIITAGYPCQPFSHAGSRKGTNDSRHIWPHIAKAISILRPRYVILENVRGHLSLGLKEVLEDLTNVGYDAQWRTVRASDTGAPHRRERIFIVAQPTDSNSERLTLGYNQSREVWNQGQPQLKLGELVEAVTSDSQSGGSRLQRIGEESQLSEPGDNNSTPTNSFSLGLALQVGREKPSQLELASNGNSRRTKRIMPRNRMHLQSPPTPLDETGKLSSLFVAYMMGLPEGWVTDCGLSRAQTLKMLGNGVVPQQAKLALELMV